MTSIFSLCVCVFSSSSTPTAEPANLLVTVFAMPTVAEVSSSRCPALLSSSVKSPG